MLCMARAIVTVIVTVIVIAMARAIVMAGVVHVFNRPARVLVECLFAEGLVVGNGLAE